MINYVNLPKLDIKPVGPGEKFKTFMSGRPKLPIIVLACALAMGGLAYGLNAVNHNKPVNNDTTITLPDKPINPDPTPGIDENKPATPVKPETPAPAQPAQPATPQPATPATPAAPTPAPAPQPSTPTRPAQPAAPEYQKKPTVTQKDSDKREKGKQETGVVDEWNELDGNKIG